MAHLMEERHDIVVSHQSRLLWSGFRQIGNHCSQRIVACIVWKLITSQERPDSSMRIFRLYLILSRIDRVNKENAYREGTDPGSNIRRSQRHLWHLSPKQKTLGHLCSVRLKIMEKNIVQTYQDAM